jgi:tryptophan-rich sensory protein
MTATPQPAPRRAGAGRWWALVAFEVAVTIVAAVGGLAVAGAATEYQQLRQPGWAPPAWLFGPVWTVLYAMIAVSGWLVWQRTGAGPALRVYIVQLLLNAVWTPLFFGAGRYGLAFADIVLLWLLIGVTVLMFRRVSGPAALLLLPTGRGSHSPPLSTCRSGC